MTKHEHYDWMLKRAMEYIRKGDNDNAYASFFSDLKKYPEPMNDRQNNHLWTAYTYHSQGRFSNDSSLLIWLFRLFKPKDVESELENTE